MSGFAAVHDIERRAPGQAGSHRAPGPPRDAFPGDSRRVPLVTPTAEGHRVARVQPARAALADPPAHHSRIAVRAA